MKDDCTLLNHIRQTTEMGVDGIDSVIQYADGTFRQALEQQRTEYNKIHSSADQLLRKHGGRPEDVSAFAKWSSELSCFGQEFNPSTFAIAKADMMIRGNTMGVTKGLQTMRECNVSDTAVTSLANKLIATEQANINQMKKFL